MLPDMAKEIRQIYIIPRVGYYVLGGTIVLGLILMLWMPLTTLICGKRYGRSTKGGKTVPMETISTVTIGERESETPLMFKDANKRPIELQPITKQYNNNFDRDPSSNERFS